MKAWLWLLLTIVTLVAGCARGYYDQRPAYPGTATMNWYQNPETQYEYDMRIWRMDSDH